MAVVDSYLLEIALLGFAALGLGLLLRFLKQPSVVAYILTGPCSGLTEQGS